MSEYQYYEFLAIDRPLDRAAQDALRSISSRARITATSFQNHYKWSDLKGDPRKFMERWFDVHLYVANWGTRRLMMRVPQRFLNPTSLDPFLREVDWVEVWTSGDNVIVDIYSEEEGADDDWDDGSGRLATLAPLRTDLLAGDLRLFYLLWLSAVRDELVSDGELEPLPGIGPLTGALEAFAEFFKIDSDLMQAAAETGASDTAVTQDDLREALAAIADSEKTEFLLRLLEGDSYAAAEFKNKIRNKRAAPSALHRSVGALRTRAREIAEARDRANAERREAERRQRAEEAEKMRRVRLKALKQRGENVWSEIEEEVERRNASGYDRAASLLSDLGALAAEEGSQGDFDRRLASISARHVTKRKFIERLTKLGLDNNDTALLVKFSR
jgi:hypothetical protein